MEKNIGILLNNLQSFHNGCKQSLFVKSLLDTCKLERKKYSKDEYIQLGYDIYENKGTKIDVIVQYAVDKNFVEALDNEDEDKKVYKITEAGLNYLKSFLTDNYSDKYQHFRKELIALLNGNKKPIIDEINMMNFFWHKRSPEEAANHFINWSHFEMKSREYQLHILNKLGYKPEDLQDKFIFHIAPKLFVPNEMIGRKVALKIEGIDTPNNLFIGNPYPNKRYYVAGIDFGVTKSTIGLFPIITSRDAFPEQLSLKLIWSIEGGQLLTHYMNISFEITDEVGNMLSTSQIFSRSINLKSFSAISYYDENFTMENRSPKYAYKGNNIEILEDLTLNNFPLETQSGFIADQYFNGYVDLQAKLS